MGGRTCCQNAIHHGLSDNLVRIPLAAPSKFHCFEQQQRLFFIACFVQAELIDEMSQGRLALAGMIRKTTAKASTKSFLLTIGRF